MEYTIVYNNLDTGELHYLVSLGEVKTIPRKGDFISITRTPNGQNYPLVYLLEVTKVVHTFVENKQNSDHLNEITDIYIEFLDGDGYIPEEW